MEKKLEIGFPIFANYTIFVVLTDDVIKSRTDRNAEIGEKYDGGIAEAMLCYSLDKEKEGMAWMFLHYNASPGIIAHESVHAIHRLWDFVGVSTAKNDSEIFAYHVEYVVERIWNHLKKLDKEAQCIIDSMDQPLGAQSGRITSQPNFVDC